MQHTGKPDIKREISAGVIVYRKTDEGIKFLILYHGHNYWNFPKGKIESEEKSMEAALRETKEETGIGAKDLMIAENFKTHERFYFRRAGQSIYKIVIFYLGEATAPHVTLSDEHNGYAWYSFEEARRILGRYRDSQRVLKQACDFLKGRRRQQAPMRAPHRSDRHNNRRRGEPQKYDRQKREARPHFYPRSTRTYRSHSPWQGGYVRGHSQGGRAPSRDPRGGERAPQK